jgi:ATPases involved in chromosome partitioning
MRQSYDYILLDTPPFPMVGDALLLGSQADRILTVARVHATPRKAFKEHLQGLINLEKPLRRHYQWGARQCQLWLWIRIPLWRNPP